MDVSVIFVNYNTVSLLKDAIDSVFEKTRNIQFEIIVIDNNSSDNSSEILKEIYGDKIVFFQLQDNIGFGRANNEAIKIAKGRNVFLLNPDTILLNNATKILSDYLDNHLDVGACGGNLFDENKNPTISFSRMLPSFSDELNQLFFNFPYKILFGKNWEFNYTGRELDVACIIGADMMLQKKVFELVGGFDADFFMYHEELELAYRIKKAKYRIVSLPSAEIIHLEGKSISCSFDRKKKMLNARNLYLSKTHNKLQIFILDIIFYIASLFRIAAFKILNNAEKLSLWSFILKNIK